LIKQIVNQTIKQTIKQIKKISLISTFTIIATNQLQAKQEVVYLSSNQLQTLRQVKKIVKNEHLDLQNTVCAITLTETSGGQSSLIGDNYYSTGKIKPFIERSLGINQVKLYTAQIVIEKTPELKKYRYLVSKPGVYMKYSKYLFELKRFKSILKNPIWVKRWKQGRGLRTKRWVLRNIRYYNLKLKKYRKYFKKDVKLASRLLTDNKLNTLVAAYYLKMNYLNALKYKRYKKFRQQPWRFAVSRYNGGNQNKRYLKKVIKNLSICRAIR